MSFKPPYSQDADRPITATPVIRVVIQASDKWFATVGDAKLRIAEEIVARNGGSIRQFYLAQLQGYRAGAIGVQTTHLRLKEIDLMLQVVQGSAILTVTVKPENVKKGEEGGVEINLDGYIAWICDGPAPFDPIGPPVPDTPVLSYTFFLNGAVIYSFSALPAEGAVLFKFGPTALRCHSLSDLSQDPAVRLTNEIIPERPQVGPFASVNPGDPTDIAKHRDIPAYLVLGVPVIQEVVLPVKSPLKSAGNNEFRVDISPATPFRANWSTRFTIYAEFYARQFSDKVKQSWSLAHGSADIVVNDKPLYWAMGTGAFPVQAMDFDLTPKNTPDTSTPTPVNIGSAYSPPADPTVPYDGTVLHLWKDSLTKGYWRLFDLRGGQIQPPFGLWALALAAADRVASATALLLVWTDQWPLVISVNGILPPASIADGGPYISGSRPVSGEPTHPYITSDVVNPITGPLGVVTTNSSIEYLYGFLPGVYVWSSTYSLNGPATITDTQEASVPTGTIIDYTTQALQLATDGWQHNKDAKVAYASGGSDYAADPAALAVLQQALDTMNKVVALVATMKLPITITSHVSKFIEDTAYPAHVNSDAPYYAFDTKVNVSFGALGLDGNNAVFMVYDADIQEFYREVTTIEANAKLLVSAIQGFDLQPV